MTATVREALSAASARLLACGVESAATDARLLLQTALGVDRGGLMMAGDRALTGPQAARFESFLVRRERREPVSRILGRRGFWSLDLAVTPAVLDPRPESETLIEAALEMLPDADGPYRILDLGVGSGCLLLAMLAERPAARGIGVDRSWGAVATARENARRCGLQARASFMVGDWGSALGGVGFDLILSNPPYIAERERACLQPEVGAYDPDIALFAGSDGLDAYRALAPALSGLLRPEGVAILEVGRGQAAAVEGLLAASGLVIHSSRQDLAGIPRAIIATR